MSTTILSSLATAEGASCATIFDVISTGLHSQLIAMPPYEIAPNVPVEDSDSPKMWGIQTLLHHSNQRMRFHRYTWRTVRIPRGHRYLLVIAEFFTKLSKTVLMNDVSAREVVKHLFVENWVFNYGPQTDLRDDNGKQFDCKFFHRVCRILNVQNCFTTTYHRQMNGQVERFNRSVVLCRGCP